METVKERTENVEKRAAAERTELAELRELVFTQANAVEMGGLEPDKAAELRFPYSTRRESLPSAAMTPGARRFARFFPTSPLSTVSRDPTRI